MQMNDRDPGTQSMVSATGAVTHIDPPSSPNSRGGPALALNGVNCWYGGFRAVRDVQLTIPRNKVTALIGPSGCGKSTLLRSINRMNDLVPSFRMEGEIEFEGTSINSASTDVIDLRRRVGMVFQKPNPFPKSIFENVAFGLRLLGVTTSIDTLVEESLRAAALWDDVKDKLDQPGLSLSGGQKQRLCIARAIAIRPEVILMDEPCSALDPKSTL